MNKVFILFLCLTIFCLVCSGQEAAGNSAKMDLIVTDKSNVLIGDLKKEEITLLIDGKPQTILALEKQPEQPLIYGLAVDTSGSMRLLFSDIIKAAGKIVGQNQPTDETMLVSFISSDRIRAAKEFSSDKNLLTRTINEFYVEGGATALIDAVYMTVEAVAKHKRNDPKNFRRAVIVITDGEDRDSFYTEKKLLDLLAKENVQVFFIGLTDGLSGTISNFGSVKDKSVNLMKRIAQASGGGLLSESKKKMSESADAVLPLARTGYLLSYTSPVAQNGNSPKIEIKPAKDSKRDDLKFYFRR